MRYYLACKKSMLNLLFNCKLRGLFFKYFKTEETIMWQAETTFCLGYNC